MLVMTPDEIRKAEDSANENGLSYEDMMESAGMGCAEYILSRHPDCNNIVILCGKGKNGGDGFVIARYLSEAKRNVNVICCFNSPSDPLSEKNKSRIDGTVNFYDGSHITKKIFSLISEADIIVDAVFGIGFKGNLPESIKELFCLSDKASAIKIAVDIPSGVSVNNDITDGCFRADETLSMLCFKKEHIYKPYSTLCGKVSIIPIGFSCFGKYPEAKTAKEIKDMLPERPFDGNKGTFGKALIIAGSYKMPGAAIISTRGALSSGAGLTFLAFPDKIYSPVTSQLTECVFRPLPSDENGEFSDSAYDAIKDDLNSFSAIAIGPGIGTGVGATALLHNIVKNYNGKLIIDADGINIISRNIDILKESQADILLTPHPGEMSRLISESISVINSDRLNAAKDFAQNNNITLLLKGASTVISDKNGNITINPTGSEALARGGSGDLLTGIAVSFAAQGKSVSDSAVIASYIHGLAGDTAKEIYTSFSSTVERITDCIPEALSRILWESDYK